MLTVISFVVILLLVAKISSTTTSSVEAFVHKPVTYTSSSSRSSSITRSTKSTKLDAYKKVFVAGGSKGVGRIIVEKLANDGTEVIALVRNDDSINELKSIAGVTPIKGDAFIYKDVENAMDGCDAVITTLGGSTSDDDNNNRIDYVGNSNVIEAAGILGIMRLILITSIGCGSSKEAPPPSVYEVLKDTLAAKERAENILIKYYTTMNWTIIRPGGLKSEPATNTAKLTDDNMVIASINREDVANLVINALTDDSTERKVLSAIDPSS